MTVSDAIVGIASDSGGVALAQGAGLNRTKRQFDAERCDPAYCQIPVSKVILMWDNKLLTKTGFDKLNPHIQGVPQKITPCLEGHSKQGVIFCGTPCRMLETT